MRYVVWCSTYRHPTWMGRVTVKSCVISTGSKSQHVTNHLSDSAFFITRCHSLRVWILTGIQVQQTARRLSRSTIIQRLSRGSRRNWYIISNFLAFSPLILVTAFNLINDIDVAETEARITRYRQENAALIKLNQQREEEYQRYLQEQEEMERQERELRAQELRRLEEEEREEREKGKQAIIDKLETSDKDAARLVAKSRMEAQRRASARAASSSSASFSQSNARLLRNRATQSAVVPDVPHVPLQDNYYAYDDMFKIRDSYHDPVSEAVRRDREGIMRAGGYQVDQAWERALRFAVAGLEIAPLSGMPSPPSEPMAVDSEGPADVIMALA